MQFKSALVISILLCSTVQAGETEFKAVTSLAEANGFRPDKRIVQAIVSAAKTYKISAVELASIAIVETGIGKYSKVNVNANGTRDVGLFQINTINHIKCVEFNLYSPEGSSLCAAKLISTIRTKHSDYLGRYHSKTPSKKMIYKEKISKVFTKYTDKLYVTRTVSFNEGN